MNTEDRELLELAAKASGIEVLGANDSGIITYPPEGVMTFIDYTFNPLTDDGDAFRLECDLSLSVSWGLWSVTVAEGKPWQSFELFKDHGDDKAAARRTATLRAAAKIGRRMA